MPDLLNLLEYQTVPPDEIIIYVSGISGFDIPKQIYLQNSIVPIYTVFSCKRTNQSVARNICAKIASHEIVMLFDVDDEPHPQKIEITKLLFAKYNPDFMVHNYIQSNIRHTPKFDDIDTSTISIHRDLTIDHNNTNILCNNMPIHHAHISVKTHIFNNIQYNETPELYSAISKRQEGEDGKFCQDLLSHGYNGIYCPNPLVRYIL